MGKKKVRCPKCGSTSYVITGKGYLLADSDREIAQYVCQVCGQSFMGKLSIDASKTERS